MKEASKQASKIKCFTLSELIEKIQKKCQEHNHNVKNFGLKNVKKKQCIAIVKLSLFDMDSKIVLFSESFIFILVPQAE